MNFIKSTEFKIFFSIAIFFVIFAGWVGWNESSRIALSKSLVREGSFKINSYADMTGDRATYEGDYYSDKMPGVSILSTPIFLVADFFADDEFKPEKISIDERTNLSYRRNIETSTGVAIFLATFLLSGMLTVATGYLLYLFSGEFIKSKRIRYLVPIIYCLGTIALSSGLHLQGHATVAFFSFASFYLFFYRNSRYQGVKWTILTGLLIGIAFSVDFLAIFVFVALFIVYLFRKEYKRGLHYIAGFFVIFGLLLGYNTVNFDGPLDFGYLNVDLESPQFSQENVDLDYYNQKMGEEISLDNLEEALASPQTSLRLLFHPAFYRYRGAIMIRSLFFPERGLLFFSPILILSFIGFFVLWKKNKELFFISIFTFLSVLWFRSTPYIKWWGGASFGLRHMMITIPFLMIPLIAVIEKINKKAVYTLVVISVVLTLFGGLQRPVDLDPSPTLINQEHIEEIKSFEIIDSPLTGVYLENFKRDGFDSPLIQNSLMGNPFDIRLFSQEKMSSTSLTHTPFGFLVVDFKYFSILLPLFILFVIWFSDLKVDKKCVAGVLFLLLTYNSFSFQSLSYGQGWYEGENLFMGREGQILIHSNQKDQFFKLKANPHFNRGGFSIVLNDDKIYKFDMKKKKEVAGSLDLVNGWNELILKADDCFIPNDYLNNDDYRCLGLEVEEFNVSKYLEGEALNNFLDEKSEFFNKGFFELEKVQQDKGRWMTDTAKLKIPETGIGSELEFNLFSYKRSRNLTILDGGRQKDVVVPEEGGRILINPQSETIKLETSCQKPSEIEDSSDDRCLGVFIRNIRLTP